MKRKNKLISGLEFFDFKHNQNSDSVLKLEEKIGDELPSDLKQYLLHFKPFDWWDDTLYEEPPIFGSEKIISTSLIDQNYNIYLPYFSVEQIIDKLNHHERFEDFFSRLKLIPICQSVPNYEVVYCFEGEFKGRLFYNTDDYEFELDDTRLFAHSLWDFILHTKIVEY